MKKITKENKELIRNLFEKLRKAKVDLKKFRPHDMANSLECFYLAKVAKFNNSLPEDRRRKGNFYNGISLTLIAKAQFEDCNLSIEELRELYGIIATHCIEVNQETFDTENISKAIKPKIFTLKFFVVALADDLIDSTHPHYEEILKSISRGHTDHIFVNDVEFSETMTKTPGCLRSSILAGRNFVRSYEFIKGNYDVLVYQYGHFCMSDLILKIHDILSIDEQKTREEVEPHLHKSVSQLIELAMKNNVETETQSVVRMNAPSAELADTNQSNTTRETQDFLG